MEQGLTRRTVVLSGAAAALFAMRPNHVMAADGFWQPAAILSQPMTSPRPAAIQALIERGDISAATPPLSLSKFALLPKILEKFQDGSLDRMQPITFSEEAIATPPIHLNLRAGDTMPAIDVAALMVRVSCNICATQMGISLFGSADNAINEMNAQARSWGLAHTRYVSPSGINIGSDYGITTAQDMLTKAVWIDSLWRTNMDYQRVMNRGGYVLQQSSLDLLRGRNALPRAHSVSGGITLIGMTGDAFLPEDNIDFLPFKTGTWRDGRGVPLKNFLFAHDTPSGRVYASMMAYPETQIRDRVRDLLEASDLQMALSANANAPSTAANDINHQEPERRNFLSGLLRPQDIRP